MRIDHVQVSCPAGGEEVALTDRGYRVTWDNDSIPGRRRFHTADGHGNRVEIV
jgi:hypothetical protein